MVGLIDSCAVCFQGKVGLIAVNDSLYVENAIYVILRKYFRSKTYYVDLLELFHDVSTAQHGYNRSSKMLLLAHVMVA